MGREVSQKSGLGVSPWFLRKNCPLSMRYSLGKTHTFQMKLYFSIDLSCFGHKPDFSDFFGFFMVRFASLVRERGTFQKNRSSRPRGVSRKKNLQHLPNGSRLFWQYVLPVRTPGHFSQCVFEGLPFGKEVIPCKKGAPAREV